MFLQRYMAMCLGLVTSLLLLFEIIWSIEISKCSLTFSMMSCAVISFFLSGVMMFCSSFFARSSVMSVFSSLAMASSLFSAPSSSRMLDLM